MSNLIEILAKHKLPGHFIQAIVRRVKNYPQTRLDIILSDFPTLLPGDIAMILSEHTNLPLLKWEDIDVAKIPITNEKLMPKSALAVPISVDEDQIVITVGHPKSKETKDLSAKIYAEFKKETIINISDRITRQKVFQIFQHDVGVFDALRKNIITAEEKVHQKGQEDINQFLTQIISEILHAAATLGASDIQFLATATFGQVFMKIQGTGHIAAEMRRNTYDRIMRVFMDEISVPAETIKKKSVEAAITKFEGVDPEIFQLYNFRVQVTMPEPSEFEYTVATVRLLARSINIVSFQDAGFNDQEIRSIKNAVDSVAGLILLVGPVNCGKSTTLYTMMVGIDAVRRLVKTIENPIEFRAAMWEQNALGSTDTLEEELSAYRDQIKAMVRKSPDCLLAGEIRTVEEAKQILGLAYASTLCFSSMHSENIAGALGRLRFWGIPNIDLAAVLRLIIAQRLIRQLCEHCKIKESRPQNQAQFDFFAQDTKVEKKPKIYAAKYGGCEKCQYTGFSGRLLIAEMLSSTNPGFKQTVHKGGSLAIDEMLRKDQSSLWHSGMRYVFAGKTSVGEVVRNVGRVPIDAKEKT